MSEGGQTGFLEGKVTIAPIYPHERMGVENEADAEIYRAHKLAVLTADGVKKIKEIELDGKGYFKTELAPGGYIVDVVPHDIGIGKPGNIPQPVTIEAGKTTLKNIELDTGIR
jgi:hypothetical protein